MNTFEKAYAFVRINGNKPVPVSKQMFDLLAKFGVVTPTPTPEPVVEKKPALYQPFTVPAYTCQGKDIEVGIKAGRQMNGQPLMSIDANGCLVTITKEQAMAFFGLVDPSTNQ